MSDTSLVFNIVARERASRVLTGVRDSLDATGKAAQQALVKMGVGVAPASALVATMVGVASSFAAAGVAAQAFQAAAGPQLAEVTEAAQLYAKAQEAAAEGGEAAAKAQEEYNRALAEMQPATRDTAVAFIGLKEDFAAWSDELSGTTMPIFTRGIQVLRDLLPQLTPFVTAASGAIGGFMDKVEDGASSPAFQDWADDMSTAAGPAMENLLATVGNLAVGFGGLLQAFLPVNSGMHDLTDSMVVGSEAFENWATGLKGSEGFAEFTAQADTGSEALGNVAAAGIAVLMALGPLLGTTIMLANSFSTVVAATPTPVLTTLAFAITAVTIGMRLWALYQTAVTVGTVLWTGAQWLLNGALWASPITWIIAGIVALIAIIVLIATQTTWFQDIWRVAWDWMKDAAANVWNWIKDHWPLLLGILLGPIGVAVGLIVDNWDSLVGFISGLPDRIGRAAGGMWDGLTSSFRSAINDIISGWNGLSFSIPGIDWPGPGSFGGVTLGTPNIPYLAKGGDIMRAGAAIVGERGPEMLSLPAGARVTPLSRGGGMGGVGGVVRVEINLTGADEDLKRRIRRMVRVDGRGNVQVAFGKGT